MFYLKEFFSSLWDIKLRGMFFLTSSFLVALTLSFKPTVQSALTHLSPDAWARPYFTALFDANVQKEDVLADLENRPEVDRVELVVTTESQSVFGKLLTQIGKDYQTTSADVAAFGLRVILKNKQMIPSAQNLIQGLEKSHGETHMTTSGIKMPKIGGMLDGHPIFNYLSRFGYLGALVPLMLVWFFSLSLVYNDVSKRAWLIERFQRRKFVRAKIIGAGFVFILSLATIATFAFQGPDFVAILLCLSAFAVPWATTLREVKWTSQN
jgi:hypothetical protein